MAVALAALIGAGVARADGDPASDVLYSGHVFFPYSSPISKSAQIAGLPIGSVRHVACDENQHFDLGALRTAIEEDRAVGRSPFMVIGSAGTVHVGW